MPSTPTPRPPPSPDLINTKVPPSRSSSSTTYPSDPDPTFTLVESAKSRRNKGRSPVPTSTQFGPPATPPLTPTSPHAASSPDVADAGKRPSAHPLTKSHSKSSTNNDAAVTRTPTPTSRTKASCTYAPPAALPPPSSPFPPHLQPQPRADLPPHPMLPSITPTPPPYAPPHQPSWGPLPRWMWRRLSLPLTTPP